MVPGPLEGDPVRLEARVNTRVVDLDHEVAVVIVWDLREYCVEVDHSEARLSPEPLARGQFVVADWLTVAILIKMVREAVLDVNTPQPVGIPPDERCRIDARPTQMAGVRPEAEQAGPEFIEQPSDLVLGLKDTADMGVVQRPEAFVPQHFADDSAVLDGERKPVLVEPGTDRWVAHPFRQRHRGHHRPVEA